MLQKITKWFGSPQFPNDEDKTRSALLLNVVLNTFLIALPVIIIGILLGDNIPRFERVIIVISIAWLTMFGARRIMLAGSVAMAGIATVVSIFMAATLSIYNLGTIRAPATAFYILTIVMSGLIVNRRAIVWMAGICTITVIMLLIGERNGLLPQPTLTVNITQGVTFSVVFAIISILLYLAVKSTDEALLRVRQELAERQHMEKKLRASEERLEILHEIDRALISTANTLTDIAREALVRIRRLVPCARVSVSLFDLKKNEAYFLAAAFEISSEIGSTPISIQEYGQHIVAELQRGRPFFMHNVLTDSRALPLDLQLAQQGIHAWLHVPLLYQGQLIGALNLGRGIGESFNTAEAETAQDVANQLAIAIQQTRLYDALQVELTAGQNLIAQLEANNAELERFTYTVSHDLRNPLVTIKGFLGMLDKDIRENRQDRIQTDFQRIAGATDKMDELLSDLLELSRIGRIVNPPEEVDLATLVQDALELLDARIHSKNITVSVARNLPSLYGDRLRLREVLENLIDNAAKYVGNQPNPVIEIGTRQDKNEQVIFVKDNGIGIEARYQTRVFALFEKLNPSIEGTGIGLALVKRIVEVHGGRVWVESEGLEKGSTFCFTIPNNVE